MTFAVMCPGQGAQHGGMLDVVRDDPGAAAVIDEARTALGVDPREWLADPGAMFENAIAQPLICITQLALWRALRDRLPAPALFAGYSVGELACYGVADALDTRDLARLAEVRAREMDEAAAALPGGLCAVRGIRRAPLSARARAHGASIAIAVAADAFVVGGSHAALAALRSELEGAGAQITALRVGLPAHTPQLTAAVPAFRAALERSPLRAPAAPVVAGIDARRVATRERAIATLSTQVAATIEWGECLVALHERGCRVYLELPPGRALSRMVRDRFDDVDARAVEEFRDLAAVAAWVRRKVGERA
jgi:[acyl-carrier-protein] S-malonyltransferase